VGGESNLKATLADCAIKIGRRVNDPPRRRAAIRRNEQRGEHISRGEHAWRRGHRTFHHFLCGRTPRGIGHSRTPAWIKHGDACCARRASSWTSELSRRTENRRKQRRRLSTGGGPILFAASGALRGVDTNVLQRRVTCAVNERHGAALRALARLARKQHRGRHQRNFC